MSILKNAFKLLHPDLKEAIRTLGYKDPTDIQSKAIPQIINETAKNFLIIAPTGSGKTEAVLFPIISKILYSSEIKKGIQVLYITPLRALNRDIFRRIIPLIASKLGLTVEIRHGDTPSSRREKQARRPPVILITTPESLQAILCGSRIREALRSIRYVIIDEVHALVDNKRGCQLAVGLERIRELSSDFSIIAISATVHNDYQVLEFITGGRGGKIIRSEKEKRFEVKIDSIPIDVVPSRTIFGFGIKIDVNKIAKKIAEIVNANKGKVLVFTNTRDMTEMLGLYLRKYIDPNKYAIHHSSLSKDVRISVENRFKTGDLEVVIATSSLELGIDIGEADLVIQVMSPRRAETAIQRIGRSGHMVDLISKGIIITATPDDLYESVAIIENIKARKIEPLKIIGKSYDVLAHQIIGIAREKYLERKEWPKREEVYRIIKRAWPFRDLSFREFQWVLDLLHNRIKLIIMRDKRIILRRGALKYYFSNLSTIPSTLKYDVIDLMDKKRVGELDEKYVLDLSRGDTFLLGGLPREVVEINAEKKAVFVMTTYGIAHPPRWLGDILPVSYEVAIKVGALRRLWRSQSHLNRYLSNAPLSEYAKKLFMKIAENYPRDKPIPDDRTILVEYDLREGLIIIHSPFGNEINKAFALLLSYVLTHHSDFPLVGVDSDAYRIKLSLYSSFYLNERKTIDSLEDAFNMLLDLYENKQNIYEIIRDIIIETRLDDLQWYFIQILRRFGIIHSDAYLTKSQIMRLISVYRDTPVMSETVNEFIFHNLDINGLVKVLEKISRGEINIWFTRGLSTLALQVPIFPQYIVKNLDEIINRKYEEKLLNKDMLFICLRCGYNEIRKVRDGIYSACPKCGSLRITVTKPSDENLVEIIRKALRRQKLEEHERQKLMNAEKISKYLRAYREITALVLATTGIGFKSAMDILKKFSGNKKELIKELRKREANYWKNRQFWED